MKKECKSECFVLRDLNGEGFTKNKKNILSSRKFKLNKAAVNARTKTANLTAKIVRKDIVMLQVSFQSNVGVTMGLYVKHHLKLLVLWRKCQIIKALIIEYVSLIF